MSLNKFDIKVLPVVGGYLGYLRFAKDSCLKPVLGKRGKPILFSTEITAWQELTRRLLKYINGSMVRDGEVIGAARKQAEDLFKKKGAED